MNGQHDAGSVRQRDAAAGGLPGTSPCITAGTPVPPVRVAVVIPCYRVRDHVLGVIERLPPGIVRVYVVDDACPEGTGDWVQAHCRDPRVSVLRNAANLGVGGAAQWYLEEARRLLAQQEQREAKIAALRVELKKETQFNRKVELNMEIKRLEKGQGESGNE